MAKNPLIEKLNRLVSVPAKFETEVEKAQNLIYKNFLKKLNALELDSEGRIVLSKSNLAQMETLGEELEAIIMNKNGPYYSSVKDFIKEMDEQKLINQEFFSKEFEFTKDADFDALYETSRNKAIERLSEGAVTTNVNAFKDMLQESIATQDKFTNFVGNLQNQMLGNDKVDGGMLKYARQNAKDLYSIADREYSNAVSYDLGIVFYEYSGGTISTSRCFCKERNGKIFHKKEIEAWGRGETTVGGLSSCGSNWDGKARNTNENTIFSLLGGYNCDHVLVPIAVKNVPLSVIERNIASGNIKKSDLPKNIQDRLG